MEAHANLPDRNDEISADGIPDTKFLKYELEREREREREIGLIRFALRNAKSILGITRNLP